MYVLFDLDGTLTDSKEGIINSIKYALEKLNLSIPKSLDWCIGPPLLNSFEKILEKNDGVDPGEALDLYREFFTEKGIYQNLLYPDIPELLKKLVREGMTLYVATSKPTVYAEKIVHHFNLLQYFKTIYGSELSGERNDKKDLIAYLLKKENLNTEKVVMVGDRKYDLIAANANNISSIGVTYGYGSYEELCDCEPNYIVTKPLDIFRFFDADLRAAIGTDIFLS